MNVQSSKIGCTEAGEYSVSDKVCHTEVDECSKSGKICTEADEYLKLGKICCKERLMDIQSWAKSVAQNSL